MQQQMKAAQIVAAVLLVALSAAPALAQNNRTFVSGDGLDTNPCSRSAPCRTFKQALSVTNAGGEIVVLSSAGYGQFTITKAISITAIGVEAAITVNAGDGITITAGASDVVNLRNLILVGGLDSNNGITFNLGGALNIQNCTVIGFNGDGLHLVEHTPASISVSDTVVAYNGQNGIDINPAANASAIFERVQAIYNLSYGFAIDAVDAPAGSTVQALAVNSLAVGNAGGFTSASYSNNSPVFVVVNSTAVENTSGLTVGGDAGTPVMMIANSKIYGNPNFGFGIPAGSIKTFGNNYFANNGTNVGSTTPIAQQ
jgi:hypothetical protein